MSRIVVIVESPTKAKAIQEYLGSSYLVKASMGHVADLPAKLPSGAKSVGVSVTSKDPPKVEFPYGMPILPDKKKLVGELQKTCSGSDVLLATDPDREGEAIAWCLQNLLKKNAKGMKRVTFDAITLEGIKKGMKKIRNLDRPLVSAQLGRRSLDRLFGYCLSILASKAIGVDRLSVGRVQTAVLSLVVDREEEIKNFKPEPRYVVTLLDKNGNLFRSKVFEDKKEAEKLLKYVNELVFKNELVVTEVKKELRNESPLPPLKTSSMQQLASRLFGFSPNKTMSVAQQLFEKHHLITYHRSDSIRIDKETRDTQEAFAKEVWPEYVPDNPNIYRNSGNVQDAHECVHPTCIDKEHTPEKLKTRLADDIYKVYNMIWSRFHGSLSKHAVWEVNSVSLGDNNSGNKLLFLQGRKLIFDGWRRIDFTAPKSQDKIISGDFKDKQLVNGKVNTETGYTKPPQQFTMPDLLKEMEKNGVGRPATMASSVETLFTRKYVNEQQDGKLKKIVSTPLGKAVIAWASEVCPALRDVKYTSDMENKLDEVSEGKEKWEKVVVDYYYNVIEPSIEKGKKIISEATPRFELKDTDKPKYTPYKTKSYSKKSYSSGKYSKTSTPGKNYKNYNQSSKKTKEVSDNNGEREI